MLAILMAVTTTKVYKLCHGMTVVDGTLDQLNGIEVVDSKEIEKKREFAYSSHSYYKKGERQDTQHCA